jgi:hypothetical protein
LNDAKSESFEEDEVEIEEPHTAILRRSMRERRQPERYSPPNFRSNFYLSITEDDPRTVKEAMNSKDSKLWKKAVESPKCHLFTNIFTSLSLHF